MAIDKFIFLLVAVILLIVSLVKKLFKLVIVIGVIAVVWFLFGDTIIAFMQNLM